MFHATPVAAVGGDGVESAVRALLAEPAVAPAAKAISQPEPVAKPAAMAIETDADEAQMATFDELSADDDFDASPQPAPGFGNPPDFIQKMTTAPAATSAPTGRNGMPMIAAGVVLLIAALGGGYMMMGKDEPTTTIIDGAAPATETAAETTTTIEPVATTAASSESTTETTTTAEPEAEVAVAETSSQPTTVAEPEPQPEPATETASAEPAAEAAVPASAIAPPVGTLLPNQIGFAAWDATIPFIEENRIIGGARLAVVSRILPTTELAEVGDWLAPGLILYTVNGKDIQQSGGVTAAVLNSMQVDPDGKARVVVEYSGDSSNRETGLLTVSIDRLVSLANGVNLRVTVVDGKWQTVVTGVTMPEKTELRQGDILFRDKTTGLAIDQADAVETAMAQLVEAGTGLTTFSIIRDNKLTTAAMQLAVQP